MNKPASLHSLSRRWSYFSSHLLHVITSVLVLLFITAAPASAQWRIGGFLGGEHESSWDEFLVLGPDARGAVSNGRFELNPRLTYFLREGMTRLQVELNLIKPLRLAAPGRVEPYLGVGVALESASFDSPGAESETNFGYNYVVGGTWKTTGSIQPFGQFTYTVLHEAPNTALITLGIHFKMGGGR